MMDWESQDPWVKRAHESFAHDLARFKLTEAQKLLLLYNTSGMRRYSCIEMMRDDIGHLRHALYAQTAYFRAFNMEFIIDHQDRHAWFEKQWIYMHDNQYWESVLCTHGVFDWVDLYIESGYYDNSDAWNSGSGPGWVGSLVQRELSPWES